MAVPLPFLSKPEKELSIQVHVQKMQEEAAQYNVYLLSRCITKQRRWASLRTTYLKFLSSVKYAYII